MGNIELVFMQVCDSFIIHLHHYSVEIVQFHIWRKVQNFFWIMGQPFLPTILYIDKDENIWEGGQGSLTWLKSGIQAV